MRIRQQRCSPGFTKPASSTSCVKNFTAAGSERSPNTPFKVAAAMGLLVAV